MMMSMAGNGGMNGSNNGNNGNVRNGGAASISAAATAIDHTRFPRRRERLCSGGDGEAVGVGCHALDLRKVGSVLYPHFVFQKEMHQVIEQMELNLLGCLTKLQI